MKRKIYKALSMLLTAALVLNMGLISAWATETVITLDVTERCIAISQDGDYRIVGTTTTNTVIVEDGVTANITLDDASIDVGTINKACAFLLVGDATVNLTLAEGSDNTLKSGEAYAGLQVASVDGKTATLTIGGTGSLNATGGMLAAGIGGGAAGEGGTITIDGGEITAMGGDYGAGIGGGIDGDGGIIAISGDSTKVTATGGTYAAGIGGGDSGSGGIIAIGGGTVTATGGDGGAGIGGGHRGSGGDVAISGDNTKVTAMGGGSGAGIGGGDGSADIGGGGDGTITIDGGTVTAMGGRFAAGIGGGDGGSGGIIAIGGGTVTAMGGDGGAGIGGGDSGSGGDITISGGEVKATGGGTAAGIGGGKSGDGGDIAISGGEVTSTGGNFGAGIGGGESGDGGDIAISGDNTKVTATGGTYAAGIGGGDSGGGDSGGGGKITISSGTVTATGGDYAAGIGGGHVGSGGDITIRGGTVTATGGTFAAGIGGGRQSGGGTIAIGGGTVTATGFYGGDGIGGGNGGGDGSFSTATSASTPGNGVIFAVPSIGDQTGSGNWNGVIFEGKSGSLYGDVTLGGDLTIPGGYTLTIPNGKTLTVSDGVTLKNEGTLTNGGNITLSGNGTLEGTQPAGGTVTQAPLTGTVGISGALKYGQTLTVTLTGTNNKGTLSYRWLRGTTELGTNASYTTVEADIGQTLTCEVKSTVQTSSVSGSTTSTIAKADGPLAPGVTLSFSGGANQNKLMGATDLMELSLNGGTTWAVCAADHDLTAGLEGITPSHGIQIRLKETATHLAGTSQTVVVTAGGAVTGVTAIGCTNGSNNDGILKGVSAAMEYKADGANGWTSGTGGDITNLSSGGYQLRVKAFDTTLPGPVSSVTIRAYSSGESSNSEPTPAKEEYSVEKGVATVDRSNLLRLASGGKSLNIKGDAGTLIFDATALKAILNATSGAVTFGVSAADISNFPGAKALIGDRPALDFTIMTKQGGKDVVVPVDFGGGKVTLEIKYTPAKDEEGGGLYVVYVDNAGKATRVAQSHYDSGKRALIFNVEHFSIYGVAYKADVPAFTDTQNHWAKTSIEFVAERGLLTGTSATTFAPDDTMTRGMLWTVLHRMSGAATGQTGETWYSAAMAWAQAEGISDGASPEAPITREQLAAMLYRYEQKNGGGFVGQWMYLLPFSDKADISSWAFEAVAWCHTNGIMSGKTGGRFDPHGTATRAEIATVIMRYIER